LSHDPGQPAIELDHLTRRFGDLAAVDDVCLSIDRGAFFAFLGPNGAGKTTLLRILTGLLAPSSGDARIDGRSILRDPVAVKQHIGVVPDDLALFDRLTLHEHLSLAGPLYGLSQPETAVRAESLLRLLDLWEGRGTYAMDASHGMRKKTALAMALIHGPDVLFLDEPFEGIDPIAGESIRRLLLEMSRKGATIVLTSHILPIVERLADSIAIMAQGKLARVVHRSGTGKAGAGEGGFGEAGRSLLEQYAQAVGDEPVRDFDLPWLL
jgi:ABC-2 type transport system ATP-binding protein